MIPRARRTDPILSRNAWRGRLTNDLRTHSLVLLALAGAGTAKCCDCGAGEKPEEPGPNIGSIEVIPPAATVAESALFQLQVRFRDKDGRLIPGCDCYYLEWSLSANNNGALTKYRTDPDRHTATFRAIGSLTGPSKEVTVTATIAGTSIASSARITLVNLATGDRLLKDGDRGAPLDVALVTGHEVNCLRDRAHAFAGIALLGQVREDAGCARSGSVAVFSPDARVEYSGAGPTPAFDWTSGDDAVDVAKRPPLSPSAIRFDPPDPKAPSIRVRIQSWIPDDLGTPSVLRFIARRDVSLATRIFQDSRAGIEFELVGGAPRQFTPLAVALPAAICTDLDKYVPPQPQGPDLKDSTVMHVVYLDMFHAGLTCSAQAGQAGVILMGIDSYTPTTLAHELGHALSLFAPAALCWGHTNTLEGFEADNVMWSKIDHDVAAFRSRFSLGQVFRMSIDANSWVNQASHPTMPGMTLRAGELSPGSAVVESCGTNPYSDLVCPKVYTDIPAPAVTSPEPPISC